MATPSMRKAARVLIPVGVMGLSLLFASLASDALMLDFVYLFPLSDSLFLAGVVITSLSIAGGFAFQIIQQRKKEAKMTAVPFGNVTDKGGFLVPPQFIIGIVEKAGLPLPSMARYEEKRRGVDTHPWWWRWLFHHYTTNALASFIVCRWPKVPSIVRAADELSEIYGKCLQARRAAAVLQFRRAIEILAREGEQDASSATA